jgi:hypothetical protein
MAETLSDLVRRLKADPTQPVRATVDGLTVEVRALVEQPGPGSAAEAFEKLGPWDGETTEELLELLAAARREGGRREPQGL